MAFDVAAVRNRLQTFDFAKLFVEELGWSHPPDGKPAAWTCANGASFTRRAIAELGGVVVFELTASDGQIPAAKARLEVFKEIAKTHHENLLIFLDAKRTQSLWYWVKRDGTKLFPRDHYFAKGQPGDLFLSKLASMVVDVTDLGAEGQIPVTEVASRLKQALDVEKVTKRFYLAFHTQHLAFIEQIQGISDEQDRRWYASVLLNRLMFIYFLQKKGMLAGGDQGYLRAKLESSQHEGPDRYYADFLKLLFFEGFAKPPEQRSEQARQRLGDIRYLNGGLFLPHRVEQQYSAIAVPDAAFDAVLTLFESYSWNLNDTPGGDDNEINPDVLGYIFEKYINQKAFGAYYTRPEITEYLCEQTIYQLILDRANTDAIPGVAAARHFDTIEELLLKLDAPLCRQLLLEVLPGMSLLDPACGSGAFLVAALKTLITVYSAVVGKAEFMADPTLKQWLAKAKAEHPSLQYFIKKRVITQNLFGADIMEEATEIAKLRLFLALVASASSVDELEPLPNVDFNILPGNSLIGLLHVEPSSFDARQDKGQGSLFRKGFTELVAEKNRLVTVYRDATTYGDDLRTLRDDIDVHRAEALETLNILLLEEFQRLGIKVEEATWDDKANRQGKPRKRAVTMPDIEALHPFHWGYEFDRILGNGGFDAIITNPPWEKLKPDAKEFFAEHSELVTKKTMTIKDFEKEQERLLEDPEIRQAWLEYQARFPHISQYFRSSPDYPNQIAVVGGKKAGSDTNLYKLFLERCFRLLRDGGRCGILLPTGFYTDLGAKQLREMLFSGGQIASLFALANERFIFEGVDHRFRICLLTFAKGGITKSFETAFRMDPREAVSADRLERFLHDKGEHLTLSVDLVRRLSPDSLSLMELKTPLDITIAEKMLRFPLLGEKLEGTWNLVLTREFDMTNDSHLFRTSPGLGRLPLVEGKMFHQFAYPVATPKYWLDEVEARQSLLGGEPDSGQPLAYQTYRLAFRDVARNTDERTMIATILPRGVVCPHTVSLENPYPGHDDQATSGLDASSRLLLLAVLDSLTLDYLLRPRVTTHNSFYLVYGLPVPRLQPSAPEFRLAVERSARLTCTTPEYAGLWQEAMGTPWTPESSATDPDERARLRAELDAIVAHLYGLTEPELTHILSTFPLVPHPTKDAVLAEFRKLELEKADDPEIAALIRQGESATLELKSTARWDLKEHRKNPELERVILRTVAGFLNAQGGTLLIGVADDGTIVGLEPDYQTLGNKPTRDGFELFLTDLLLTPLGKDIAPHLTITFHRLATHDICRVTVSLSPHAIFLKEPPNETLYLRTHNSTRPLTTKEALTYAKSRWP